LPESLTPVRVGISSCLLGERVRFDGGHKRDAFLMDVFGRYVEWVPVCPEMEIGLGIPRETLRLQDNGSGIRLVASASGADHTSRMATWATRRLEQLAKLELCGYVLKRSSPSCGMERVKVYRKTGVLHRNGTGVFAALLLDSLPNLPVEEEGRLNDPLIRENFISAVFSYRRWLDLLRAGLSHTAVMEFHARHKFLLLAHSQSETRRLGNLTSLGLEYFNAFCEVMRHPPTRRNHTNVLQHLAGYFSRDLSAGDRAEVTQVIDGYRRALIPLIVPITLIRHYVRKYAITYIENQVYLNPHPHELMLLNQL